MYTPLHLHSMESANSGQEAYLSTSDSNTDDEIDPKEANAKKDRQVPKTKKNVKPTHIFVGAVIVVTTVALMCADAINSGWNWLWYTKMGNYSKLSEKDRMKVLQKLEKLKIEQRELGVDQMTFNKKITDLLIYYRPEVQIELKRQVGIA